MFRDTGLSPAALQALFNASPNPYVVMDRHCVIQGANEAYLRVTGRSAESLIGVPLLEAFPSDPQSTHGRQLRESLLRALSTGQPDHIAAIHYPISGADGRLHHETWSATHVPVMNAAGEVTHLLQHSENITALVALQAAVGDARKPMAASALSHGAVRGAGSTPQVDRQVDRAGDDTARVTTVSANLLRSAEDALRHSRQMEALGQLSGGVAHEFNNLLQIISGNLQLLAHAGDESSRAAHLARSSRAVERGAALARQLLAYGRRQPLQPQALDLRLQLPGIQALLRSTLGVGIRVHTQAADDLWLIHADLAQLETAVLNLALNARDALQGDGLIRIEAENLHLAPGAAACCPDLQPGDYVLLAVHDDGPGMETAVLERALEPFFTTKARGAGSGLGLSMAFGFAKQSGGHLKIRSSPGAGTTVSLYLPRSSAQAPAAAARVTSTAPPPLVRQPLQVLMVEDDAAVAETVRQLLQQLGHAVTVVADAQAALRQLQTHAAPDVLFTDVEMPGELDGVALAQAAQALHPRLPVLLTSGYAGPDRLQDSGLEQSLQRLAKPYALADLDAALAALVPPPSSSAVASDFRPHVLLCEDDDWVRESMVALLQTADCTVEGVGSLADARAAMARRRPDVLVTDLRLPDGDGLALAAEARRLSPTMRIAVASGRGARDAAAQIDGALHLDKPFDFSDLERLVFHGQGH